MTEVNKELYTKYLAPTRKIYAGIPEPSRDMQDIYATIRIVKQNMEIMLRQRGETPDSMLRVADLVQYDTQLQETLAALDARITALEP